MNEEKITTSANKKLSPEEIKRVKGLGCLQDKRYDDIFNIRVITGNGHITTDEHLLLQMQQTNSEMARSL